ncbi:MAG: GGDEF domain-containing protein [Lachnospiraceae bacterium]|nr:GGDEF domain-containing protein [Lachnospiraceae bacterium]
MIRLPEKERYTIGIMTGSFYTDYSRAIADAICRGLAQEDVNTDVFLFQGLDAIRYLNIRGEDAESFDRHYYSLFEYAKFTKPDLLIISFGTISGVSEPMALQDFIAPFDGVPVIIIEDDTEIENAISVTVDNYRGMYECTEHLIREHGCKKILFVSGPKNVPDAAQRLRGYRDAMEANGLYVEEDMIAYGNFTDRVDNLVEKLLSRTPHADAVCCANDEMAESAYRVLISRGLFPGSQVAVTGFDDNSGARYMNPPLTTVRQDFKQVTGAVVKVLHNLLQGEDAVSESIPAQLIIRASCGCFGDALNRPERAVSEHNDRVIEDRIKIKNLQNRNIISALLLRGLTSKDITSETFFGRLAQRFPHTGATRVRLLLAEHPVSVGTRNEYFLPERLRLHVLVDGEETAFYGFADAPEYTTETLPALLENVTGRDRQMAVFPLFCEEEHYGVLFAEIDRGDMLFFYTLSLEIGTGIRYLLMDLDRQENHRALEEKNQILDFAAHHDALTGCLNRAGVMSRVFTLLHEHEREGRFVAAMADLDYLKEINDTFGHGEGDIAIQVSASILSGALAPDSVLGRSGGDEFVCFFRGGDEAAADAFVQAVKESCDRYNETSGKPFYVEVSVGCYVFDVEEGSDLLSVFQKADEKLYRAKNKRRTSAIRKEG